MKEEDTGITHYPHKSTISFAGLSSELQELSSGTTKIYESWLKDSMFLYFTPYDMLCVLTCSL